MLSKYQKGLSPIGVFAVVCLFALLLVSALKLLPHYLDYNTLKTVYTDISNRPETSGESPRQIYSAIESALAINSIRNFDIADSTVISKENGKVQLGLDYEVREHMFGNVDVVLTFKYMTE